MWQNLRFLRLHPEGGHTAIGWGSVLRYRGTLRIAPTPTTRLLHSCGDADSATDAEATAFTSINGTNGHHECETRYRG
jgi:hypothetical protein